MTTNTTPKPALSFTSQNGAKVEVVRLTNERYNRTYAVWVNGTKITVINNLGRGRYSWPTFTAYSTRGSFIGNLRDAVDSVVSGATGFHVAGCFGDISNQIEAGRSSEKGDLDWDVKCDCGSSAAATASAQEHNDVKRAKAKVAEIAKRREESVEARRALYTKVRAALVEALDIDESDDEPVEDEGIQWLYAEGVTLNDNAVNYNKVEISLTSLAKALGIS